MAEGGYDRDRVHAGEERLKQLLKDYDQQFLDKAYEEEERERQEEERKRQEEMTRIIDEEIRSTLPPKPKGPGVMHFDTNTGIVTSADGRFSYKNNSNFEVQCDFTNKPPPPPEPEDFDPADLFHRSIPLGFRCRRWCSEHCPSCPRRPNPNLPLDETMELSTVQPELQEINIVDCDISQHMMERLTIGEPSDTQSREESCCPIQ